MENHSDNRFFCRRCGKDRRQHRASHQWENSWSKKPLPEGNDLLKAIYLIVREDTGKPYLAERISRRFAVEFGMPWFIGPGNAE